MKLEVGSLLCGYTIYAVFADEYALGRAINPNTHHQFALIHKKTPFAAPVFEHRYEDQRSAETDFVERCFNDSTFDEKQMSDQEISEEKEFEILKKLGNVSSKAIKE